MSSLAEALPNEMTRVRELVAAYQSIGPAGLFGASMLNQALDNAQQALASGDVVAILQAYERLKECQ